MLILLGFLAFFYVSLCERVRRKTILLKNKNGLPVDPVSSPFTVALGELLAIAGGVYLSLLVTVTFLELKIPATIRIGSLSLEPLAAISLIIATLQSWWARLFPGHPKILS